MPSFKPTGSPTVNQCDINPETGEVTFDPEACFNNKGELAKPYCCRQSQGGCGQGAVYVCKKTIEGCGEGPISPNACEESGDGGNGVIVNPDPFPLPANEYLVAREECDAKVDPDDLPDEFPPGSDYTPVCCKLESGQGAKPFKCFDPDININTVCPIKDVELTPSPTDSPTNTGATPRPTNIPSCLCSASNGSNEKTCTGSCGGGVCVSQGGKDKLCTPIVE